MKSKLLAIVALMASFSGAVQADGVQFGEYQQVQNIARCGYIANVMIADNTVQVMDLSLRKYVDITARMRPGGVYNPSPSDLATDYALFFQQTVSETEDEMMDQIQKRGLPLEPGSWLLVAKDWWTVKMCSQVTGL
ncbi:MULTISPECIES: hypothetical protein [unclassified Leclercia]|uniref:Uncharacterized protein n=1 Tax=Leclercia barmai TaxID=2785629 RepID=A0ABS7RT11_9ENTR|nr:MULTISPECIES: hypothetical protein [unclassified Leclercia]MBZ0057448.1 hypothetical protein [Leclercia sp. EMC7]MCM5695612.1 hypothetical protein [Leclercia sp. LTM01]MCM5700020.1 hypothetical protein [Leclercia sp. LTM14]